MINLIVATTENGVIGVDGKLPWKKQKADMKRFKELTMGCVVCMGRKTYESLPFDLPDRIQCVCTSQDPFIKKDELSEVETLTFPLLGLAIVNALKHDWNMWIIGGAQIYKKSLELDSQIPIIDEIYRTIIHTEADGDAFFEVPEDFNLIEEKHYSPDIDNQYGYTFQVYRRPSRG